MFVDMHSHLKNWSPDAFQSPEELLEYAAKKHLDGIAITDHYDIRSKTDLEKGWAFNPDTYFDENARYRKKPSEHLVANRPGLLIGIEIDYDPSRTADIRALISQYPFDCVILSQHEYNGINPALRASEFFCDHRNAVYERVIDKLAEMAENVPEANIIGHYDFFSRYAPYKRSKLMYRHAPEAFDRLFYAMIRNQQALEINTGTIVALHEERGYPLLEAMPDAKIISRYRELGGELFTLGSDAHRGIDIARYFHQTAYWLIQQGVSSYAWAEQGAWHFAPLGTGAAPA